MKDLNTSKSNNRIERIVAGFYDNNQAALVTSPANRRYLTDFKSSQGTIVITREKSYFIIDSRYYEKASSVVKNCKVILLHNINEQLNQIFTKHSIDTISIESRTLTVEVLTEYIENFPQMEFDSSTWLSDIIEKQRIIKTETELKKIETAQRIAERAYGKLLTRMKSGLTEKQVAALLNFFILEFGADDIAFPIIAASGKNSSLPHAEPTDKKIEDGEFLTLDFGAKFDGYHSDMTRTIALGAPTENMKRVYNSVLGANNDAMKAIRAGVSGKLVDNVARSTLEAWGYDKFFGHSLGHGVGLEIHEPPTLSLKSSHMLSEGMVVTVEPGVYIPGKFGVRIEDMVVVTKHGCINLSKTPKALIYK